MNPAVTVKITWKPLIKPKNGPPAVTVKSTHIHYMAAACYNNRKTVIKQVMKTKRKPNVKAKHNRNRMKLIVNAQVIRRTVLHGWSILAIRRTMNCINSRLFSILFTPPKPMVCSRIPLRMSTTWARVFFCGRLNRQNQYLPHPHTLPLPLQPAIFWLINFFTVPFGCYCCAAT